MSDVFISYAREDSEFVKNLHDSLIKSGREVWVDWLSIPITADWWREVCSGIEATHTFVFVISPASLASPICNLEIAHALKNNKRLVPVVLEQSEHDLALETLAETSPDANTLSILDKRDLIAIAGRNQLSLTRHNWLFFDGDANFEVNFQRLIEAIDSDLDHVRLHTKFLIRAREWELLDSDSSYLLTGTELKEATLWLSIGGEKDPKPSQLHLSYILRGQASASQRRRILFTAVTIALAISIGLTIFSFMLFQSAIKSLNFSNATEHSLETQMAGIEATRDAYATIVYDDR